MYLVSIIVPIYNSEKYLSECIESILNAQYKHIELLLIDDGSTDDSINICHQYANRDNRVRVFSKGNGGVSSARNLGLEYATGDWIAFIDSDDYVSPCFLKEFNHLDSSCELIRFGFKKEEDWGIIQRGPNTSRIVNLEKTPINHIWSSVSCSFCFKRSIIQQYNIRLSTNVKYSEDREFIIKYLLYTKNIFESENKPYFYRKNPTSAVNTKRSYNRCCDDFRVIYNILEFINKLQLSTKQQEILSFFINLSITSFIFNIGLNKIDISKYPVTKDLRQIIDQVRGITNSFHPLIYKFIKHPKYTSFKIWFRHQFAYVYHRYIEKS